MSKWTKEDWGTKSGKNSTLGSKATGERYLPKKAREALSSAEYKRTSDKKKEDTKKGKQFSKQPESVAKKTARFRK
jgi:basic membrane lipoprotein Med (substrate-binding protein (PBP1-ABC) superfamily)